MKNGAEQRSHPSVKSKFEGVGGGECVVLAERHWERGSVVEEVVQLALMEALRHSMSNEGTKTLFASIVGHSRVAKSKRL